MVRNRTVGQYFIVTLILGLAVTVLIPLSGPVLLGLMAALVVFPLHSRLSKAGWNRSVSALFLSIIVAVAVLIPLVLMSIAVVRQAGELLPQINADEITEKFQRALRLLPLPREIVNSSLKSILSAAGPKLTQIVTQTASSIPSVIFALVLFLVGFYYGLVDGPRLSSFIIRMLPFEKREVSALTTTAEKTCRGVVLGSVLAGVMQGCIIGIGYAALGIPGALLFGTITAFLSFVPALGSGPTAIGGILFLYAQDEPGKAIAMTVFMIVAGTSDNIIKPWVLKGSAELHPLLALMSAFGGLFAFGIAGLFLGPLCVALGLVVMNVMKPAPDIATP